MKKKQVIEKDGVQYEVVKVIKKESQKKVIVGPGWDLTSFEDWYDEKYCLKAVERNGDALRYVKEQTEAVCLKAVESDGYALQYVNKKVFMSTETTKVYQ